MDARRGGLGRVLVVPSVLLALALAACSGGDGEDPDGDVGPATTAGLQVRPVLGMLADLACADDQDPEPPGNPPRDEEAAACDLDGIGYRLGPAVVTQDGVEAADLYRLSEAWRIEVTLDPEAAEAVGELASQAASSDSQVAFVVDGLVLNAPTVGGTIGGTLQLLGPWTGAQADDYAARLAP